MNLTEMRTLQQSLNYRRNDLESIRRDVVATRPPWCNPRAVDAMVMEIEQALLTLKQAEDQELAKVQIKVKLDLNKLLGAIK